MMTFAILIGFSLMLFLPCSIAMMHLRGKDDSDHSPYADRIIESSTPRVKGPEEEVSLLPEVLAEATEDYEAGDTSDPLAPGRGPWNHQEPAANETRHAEREMKHAQAVAARAHADALIAIARSAIAKADDADNEAMLLEQEALLADKESQRAA